MALHTPAHTFLSLLPHTTFLFSSPLPSAPRSLCGHLAFSYTDSSIRARAWAAYLLPRMRLLARAWVRHVRGERAGAGEGSEQNAALRHSPIRLLIYSIPAASLPTRENIWYGANLWNYAVWTGKNHLGARARAHALLSGDHVPLQRLSHARAARQLRAAA